MSDSSADKTHAPTPRRRELARRDGDVAQSQELGSVVLLFGSVALLLLTGGALWEFLHEFLRTSLGGQAWQSWTASGDTKQVIAGQWAAMSTTLARLLLPVLAGAALVTAAVQWLQTGFFFRPDRAVPNFARVNPANGLGRMFSGANYARLALGVAKTAIVAMVAIAGLWSRREELLSLVGYDLPQLAAHSWQIVLMTGMQVGAALAVMAVVDFAVVRWQHQQRLSMTAQEVREEMRELAGDPQIAARRRQLRHAQASASSAVPGAKQPSVTSRGGASAGVGSVESIP